MFLSVGTEILNEILKGLFCLIRVLAFRPYRREIGVSVVRIPKSLIEWLDFPRKFLPTLLYALLKRLNLGIIDLDSP